MTTLRKPPAAPSLLDDLEAAGLWLAPYLLFAAVLAAAAGAALLYGLVHPEWLSALQAAVTGPEPKIFWYFSRSSALISFGLVWAAMVLGLAISNKLARAWPGGPTYVALHEHTSLLGLAFGLGHALSLLGDRYIGYSLAGVLVPFANLSYRPLWVAAGQLALYLLVPVTASFYVRRAIGQRAWRLIHCLSYAAFGLALIHGLFSGTDSAAPALLMAYWAGFLTVLGLTAYRLLTAVSRRLA